MLRSFSWLGDINTDPIVWLDRARPPHQYIFKKLVQQTQKFYQVGPYNYLSFSLPVRTL
jgi:hypothetical protein